MTERSKIPSRSSGRNKHGAKRRPPPRRAAQKARPQEAATNPWAVAPTPQSPESRQASRDRYVNAPPGEATRAFMCTAGIYRDRQIKWVVGTILSALVVALGSLVAADVAGAIEIPGMGLVYDMTGLEDPSVDRAIARVEERLSDRSLSGKDRDLLRDRLLGLSRRAATEKDRAKPKARRSSQAKRRVAATAPREGIQKAAARSAAETALIADVFGDRRKTEAAVKLVDKSQIRTPNLPDGLTQEAIYRVIDENKGSMSLCIAEAMRKGEKLDGRMDVELTINARGTVSGAHIATARFRTTVMGKCTVRRAKGWKFPRFNGDPVTVVFPYVLSVGF